MKKFAIIIPALALALASFAPSAEAATLPEIKDRFDAVEVKLDKVMDRFSDVIEKAEAQAKVTKDSLKAFKDTMVEMHDKLKDLFSKKPVADDGEPADVGDPVE